MELNQTIEMMKSEDYGVRFRAEYYQIKIRAEKLSNMLEKYRNNALDFTPKCTYEMLSNQLIAMEIYKRILEERAVIEGIVL